MTPDPDATAARTTPGGTEGTAGKGLAGDGAGAGGAELDATELAADVRALAASRLGCDVDGTRLVLERAVDRSTSRVAFLRAVGVGGASLELVVKRIRGDPAELTAPNRVGRNDEPRPRLAGTTARGERYRLEYECLVAVEAAFAQLGDPRLAWVRPLGYFPGPHALVMERVPGRSLRTMTERAALRLPGRGRALDETADACRTAGRWLRAFHAVQPDDATPVRHASRDDVAGIADALCGFLGANLGPGPWFQALGRRLVDAAGALPERLPLGLVHGDVAPRNVVVSDDGRVVLLDALGAVRAPVFEDLAYLGASLRTPVLATATQGMLRDRRSVEQLERAWVEGYWAPDPPPWSAVRLYEVLVILDKWWGSPPRLHVGMHGGQRGGFGAALRAAARRTVEAPLADRHFRSEIARLLA